MRFIVIVGILACVLLQPSVAQHAGRSIGVQLGYTHITTRSEALSPLLSSGGSASFAFVYVSNQLKFRQTVAIDILKTSLVSSAGNSSKFTLGGINYSYERKFDSRAESKFRFGAGPALDIRAASRDFTIRSGPASLNVVSSIGLAGSGFAQYVLSEKKYFELDADVVVVAYVIQSGYANSRPDDASEDTFSEVLKSGKLKAIGNFWDVAVNVKYSTQLSERFSFSATAGLRYTKLKGERLFVLATNSFLCSVHLKLGK